MTKLYPFWWDDADKLTTPAVQQIPGKADVVVIGAGHTGLSAARTLASRGRDVVVIDKEHPGFGASSRNGGMIGGGHRLSIDLLEKQFGQDIGRRMVREAHVDSYEFVERMIVDEKIDCDFRRSGRFRGFWHDQEYDRAARELEQLQSVVPVEAWMVSRGEQRREVDTDIYAGGTVFSSHGSLQPAKYVAGILAAATRAGASVYAGAPATKVERTRSGFEVITPQGKISATAVLAATNGYTDRTLQPQRRSIIPVPSFLVATEVLGQDAVKKLFPSGRMIVETRERHCYYRPSPDGQRIIFGARAAMFEAPEALVRREIKKLMTEIFPALADVQFSHSWRGRTGFTFEYLPNVGVRDGIWHAMGYSGSGNAMAPYLGHKAALQMLGDSEGETAFSHTPFSNRFWNRGYPWFLPFADVLFRFRDVQANARRSK